MTCSCLLCAERPPLSLLHKRWVRLRRDRAEVAVWDTSEIELLLARVKPTLELDRSIMTRTSYPSHFFEVAGAISALMEVRRLIVAWQLGGEWLDEQVWVMAFFGQCETTLGHAVSGRSLDRAIERLERGLEAQRMHRLAHARHHLRIAVREARAYWQEAMALVDD